MQRETFKQHIVSLVSGALEKYGCWPSVVMLLSLRNTEIERRGKLCVWGGGVRVQPWRRRDEIGELTGRGIKR